MSGYAKIWGKHAVFAAISNVERKILKVMCLEKFKNDIKSINPKVPIEIVDRKRLDRIIPNTQHQGILLMCSSLNCCKLSLCTHIKDGDKILALDQVNDPQNVGAIVRSMAALGFKYLILTKDHAPSVEGVVSKNACGALEHIHIIKVVNLADAIIRLKKRNFLCLGLDDQGEFFENTRICKEDGIVLIVGNEGKGMRNRVKSECDYIVKLPTSPAFPVLNASVSASLGMYTVNTIKGVNQ